MNQYHPRMLTFAGQAGFGDALIHARFQHGQRQDAFLQHIVEPAERELAPQRGLRSVSYTHLDVYKRQA